MASAKRAFCATNCALAGCSPTSTIASRSFLPRREASSLYSPRRRNASAFPFKICAVILRKSHRQRKTPTQRFHCARDLAPGTRLQKRSVNKLRHLAHFSCAHGAHRQKRSTHTQSGRIEGRTCIVRNRIAVCDDADRFQAVLRFPARQSFSVLPHIY